MSYCTQADMENRFGSDELIQLTDRTGAGIVDATVLGEAIEDATARIDAKLRGRYALPFASTPVELTPLACDIARWSLYKDAVPEAVQRRFEAAMRELTDYATGRNSLDVPGDEEDTSPQATVVLAADQVFSDELLGKMPC